MSITAGTLPAAEKRYRSMPKRARQRALAGIAPRQAFVDLETTGFHPEADRIIEAGVVLVDGDEVVEEYSALVRPGRPVPPEIQAFTGISEEMIEAGGCEPGELASELARLLDGAEVIAFNAPFEERFLAALGEQTGVALRSAGFLDALELARIVVPRLRKHRQVDLCEFFEIEAEPAHRALADARALARLYPILLAGVDGMDPQVRAALAALAPTTSWPLRGLFSAGARPARPDFARWRKQAPRPRREHELADADDAVLEALDEAEVAARFAPDGPLARSGLETRRGQVEMARAVARTFTERRHLVVEAGTGTGKSLAYLVPAADFAMKNGIRVVISTHSTALQDQLIDREIPRLAAALDKEIPAVVLKGYEHYVCLRRFARLWDGEELARPALALAAMITAWVADSGWDEIDSLNIHSLGQLDGLVRASQAGCLKETCRFAREGTCFMWGQRRRAAAANLLVVNHALLLANVRCGGALYPPARYVIVDEAHQLEEEARSALAQQVTRQKTGGVLAKLAGRGGRLVTLDGFDVPPDAADAVAERGAQYPRRRERPCHT